MARPYDPERTDRREVRLESPAKRTPILFVHGMWHGAWCWRAWQDLFSQEGWDSCAFSLPGHTATARRGEARFATLDDYLAALNAEIDRFERAPVVIGHSMGGALIQRRLARTADDLPAAVMLGSWTAHSTIADGTLGHLRRDPWGFMAMGLTMSSTPLVRSPRWAASLLITDGATISPEELHGRLCEESCVVLSQHNPPFWRPKPNVSTPMLWVAGERDAVITMRGARRSAAFYGADFLAIPHAGHNLMMERNNPDTAARISAWLAERVP